MHGIRGHARNAISHVSQHRTAQFLSLSHLLIDGHSSDRSCINLYKLLFSGSLPSIGIPWPARKRSEDSCFSSISLLSFWFDCNCVSNWAATLGCWDTRIWNWATLSLWCLLFVCSLNVSTAFFQLLKPFTAKAGSFLLTARFFLAQQRHCVQNSFPLVSHSQPSKILEPLVLQGSGALWRTCPLHPLGSF